MALFYPVVLEGVRKAGSGPSKVPGASGTSPAITSSSGFLELSNPFLLNVLP